MNEKQKNTVLSSQIDPSEYAHRLTDAEERAELYDQARRKAVALANEYAEENMKLKIVTRELEKTNQSLLAKAVEMEMLLKEDSEVPILEVIKMTQSELDSLPDYSCSVPTGKVDGKRWKRRNVYHDSTKGWKMGEYLNKDDQITTRWFDVVIVKR